MQRDDLVWQRTAQLLCRAADWLESALGTPPDKRGNSPCVLVNCHMGHNRSAALLLVHMLRRNSGSEPPQPGPAPAAMERARGAGPYITRSC